MNRKSNVLVLDCVRLEGRIVLSPTDPVPPAEAGDYNFNLAEELQLQIILREQAEAIKANQDAQLKIILDSFQKEAIDRATDTEINEALEPWAPAPQPVEDPSYFESFLNAVDEAIKAATESQIPLFHP